jgi:hypothetical protein
MSQQRSAHRSASTPTRDKTSRLRNDETLDNQYQSDSDHKSIPGHFYDKHVIDSDNSDSSGRFNSKWRPRRRPRQISEPETDFEESHPKSILKSARHHVPSRHPSPVGNRDDRTSDSQSQGDSDHESTPDHLPDRNYAPDSDESPGRFDDSSHWHSRLRPRYEIAYYSSDSDSEDEPGHPVTRECSRSESNTQFRDIHPILDDDNLEDLTPPHSPELLDTETTQNPDLMDMDREPLSHQLNPDEQLVDEFNSEDDEDHLIILRDQPPILDCLVPSEGLAAPQEPRRYNLRHRRGPNPYTVSGKVSERQF